jgi:hypothetical protein
MESRFDQPSATDCRDATEGDAEPEEEVISGKRRAIPAEVPVDKEMKLSGRLEGGAGLWLEGVDLLREARDWDRRYALRERGRAAMASRLGPRRLRSSYAISPDLKSW